MRLLRLSPVFISAVILILIGAACHEDFPEPNLESHRTIASQGEERAVVAIKMSAGELNVRAGEAGDLMKASFFYNRRPWEPRIDHQVSGGVARLYVEQRRMGPVFGRVRNNWKIELSRKTPMELRLDLGAGKAEIDLNGIPVTKLDIQVGVGEMDLDLSRRTESMSGQIEGGIGEADIILPEEIGVRVQIEGGLGSVDAPGFIKNGSEFRNEAWGKTSVNIDIGVEAGIGHITLRMAGRRS